jgi:replicative DNA helicase
MTEPIQDFFPINADFEMKQGDPLILDREYDRAERAEMYVVGAMMMSFDFARDGVRLLRESEFSFHACKVIFAAIGRILADNRVPSMEAVYDDLRKQGLKEELGPSPAEFLAMCFQFCVVGVDFNYKVGVIRDLAAKRDMKRIAALVVNQCDQREPAVDIANRAATQFGKVADTSNIAELVPMVTSTHAVSRQIDIAHTCRGEPSRTGIMTGVSGIDKIIPGMEPGELIVIAARPGVGKSALAALIARNVAFFGGKVMFFSLEMPHAQLTTRMLSMTSGVSLSAIRGHRALTENEKELIFNTLGKDLAQLPIVYCDRRGVTAEQVASEVRTFARKSGKPALIVVDYLQLLRADNPRDNRNYQIGMMTKSLRNVAGEVGSPIIVLAQLNRAVEGRDAGEPRLSDLRDSGEIEQDADIVTFLHHRPNPNEPHDAPEINVSLIVAKQRQGSVGKVELTYTRRTTLFSDPIVPM